MNIVSISGNVGKAELRTTQGGESILSFSVADNQFGKDSSGQPLPTTWWSCTLWGKRAVSLAQYVTKGMPVTVTGQARLRTYTDKNGIERSSLDVRVYDMALQGGKEGKAEEHGADYASVKGHSMKRPEPDAPDDDIPF